MNRLVHALAALAIAALLALAATVPAAADTSVERPFSGSVSGLAGVAPDGGCPIGLRTSGTGTGTATHLGLTTMAADHCTPNPPFGPAPGPIESGSITFTAANGDTVQGTYSGTVAPLEPVEGAEIGGLMHVAVTGGTGRFAGATGHALMTLSGVLHFSSPMTADWSWEGVLTY
jgi:hypothetical protein